MKMYDPILVIAALGVELCFPVPPTPFAITLDECMYWLACIRARALHINLFINSEINLSTRAGTISV